MTHRKDAKTTYETCKLEGLYRTNQDIDVRKVNSMILLAEEDLLSIEDLREKGRWNTMYKLSYDALHTLCEALLLTRYIKSQNHQCLFAYISNNLQNLKENWNFFERIRIKRNGLHYYGIAVDKEEWSVDFSTAKNIIVIIKSEIQQNLEKHAKLHEIV